MLPLERPDQWAALLTDKDIVTLRHRTEQRMGENTLRALASDRLDLEAGSLAGSGSPPGSPLPQPEHVLLNPEQVVCAVRAHVQCHPGLGRNGVDRRPTLNRAHRERGFRISRRLHVCDLGDGTAYGVNGAWTPELLEAMPAWTFKGHLIAVAPGRLIDDAANAQAINGDEPINVGVVPKEGSHTPQVSEFLFAHGSDEHDIADRLDVSCG